MTEIVLTLANGAVTESDLAPVAVSGDWYAAADGFHKRTGHDDDGEPLAIAFEIPLHDWGTNKKKRPGVLRLTATGLTGGTVTVVTGSGDEYPHELEALNAEDHTHRCVFGKGIVSNLLGFRIESSQSEDFVVERMDFDIQETSRTV